MLINCLYDENEYADIIFIPDFIKDTEKLQNDFFKWIFNNPSYFKEINGIKVCSYGTEDFVEWINRTFELKDIEISKIIKKNVDIRNSENQSLYF